jgi:acyl carrier protein
MIICQRTHRSGKLDKSAIKQIIFDAIEMINNLKEDHEKIPVADDTELYGTRGNLDSMGLVGFLIDVEESMQDAGFDISLSDDKAMSQRNSPFKNVETLTNYIDQLIHPVR